MSKFVVLVILDGWGIAPDGPGNAISRASTPTFDGLVSGCPSSTLGASGPAVGLPPGQMGNSEVGHMTIGAGRILFQPLCRVNEVIDSGELEVNRIVSSALDIVGDTSLHLMALLSDGGVHSHQGHLFHLLELASKRGIEPWIHVFLDGRDTPMSSAGEYLEALDHVMEVHGGRLASISGRYYSMDRDNRWGRTRLAFDAIVYGEGKAAGDWKTALGSSYSEGVTDEFVVPTVISGYEGVRNGDSVIMINFRPDRIRQISEALTSPGFDPFDIGERPSIRYTTMMTVSDGTRGSVILLPETVTDTLGEIISRYGNQLRLAETEKFAHVTFFLNDGRTDPYPGEERIRVPSPKVDTYDMRPEMSAREVSDALLERLGEEHLLFVVNYANPDMVGHTGDIEATILAVETVDECLGRLHRAIVDLGGDLVIIADHGNAEQMLDDGDVRTAHSLNRVPFIVSGPCAEGMTAENGGLKDVAPTVLSLLGLAVPEQMTGKNLLGRRG